MAAKCIMVQGTMSGVGKSLLAAALCRILRQDGKRAAPFKSQNMALNSFVTADGLEMGRAQAMQAEAAGIAPDVRMNPILLKPSSDTGSQVILNGRVLGQMPARAYFQKKRELLPEVLRAYRSLAEEYDIIVIEGAGSPAEINLRADDIVNMGLASAVDAPVLLVGDIDRGGVFAQLYGTVALLSPVERARVKGLIINRFRGDAALLAPGLKQIEALTGIPVLGTVKWLDVDIDEEDSLAPALSRREKHKLIDIAVVRLPRISNFTDFAPLERRERLGVRFVTRPRELGTPDLVILPGTKSTIADLRWLRGSGLEAAILKLASRGVPVLGICGGYQMLSESIEDPEGVEGAPERVRGLGLLKVKTRFEKEKRLRQVTGRIASGPMAGARVAGYEIHMGASSEAETPLVALSGGETDGALRGNVCGTYLHGLFDAPEAAEALENWLCARRGIAPGAEKPETAEQYRERQYDLLAAGVRNALDMDAVYRIIEGGTGI